jgi:hypothetical protein
MGTYAVYTVGGDRACGAQSIFRTPRGSLEVTDWWRWLGAQPREDLPNLHNYKL